MFCKVTISATLMTVFLLTIGSLFVLPMTVYAGEAVIKKATVQLRPDGTYSFAVTVRHDDQGWEHYADKFEILDGMGKVLGTRVLLHPHENEQPFTRSLNSIEIPNGTSYVFVRAHDKKHGLGKKLYKLELTP